MLHGHGYSQLEILGVCLGIQFGVTAVVNNANGISFGIISISSHLVPWSIVTHQNVIHFFSSVPAAQHSFRIREKIFPSESLFANCVNLHEELIIFKLSTLQHLHTIIKQISVCVEQFKIIGLALKPKIYGCISIIHQGVNLLKETKLVLVGVSCQSDYQKCFPDVSQEDIYWF